MKQGRTMVGGYSAQKSNELLSSPEVAEIANFALAQHAAGASNFGNNHNEMELENTLNLVVLPQEVESGLVMAKVLEAQRQVRNTSFDTLLFGEGRGEREFSILDLPIHLILTTY